MRRTVTLPRVPELNLDGLVGPTHNYAGLSFGNVASGTNQGSTSRPRQAALQGLAKMEALAALGVPQGVLPPHERPHLPTLRRLGYSGTDEAIVERVARDDASLLAAVSSASAMWTANAATVTPSVDAADGRVHFTPANLRSMFHRSLEPATTAAALRAAFPDRRRFEIHDPLPSTGPFGDEGAANHTRLVGGSGSDASLRPGVHLLVYGAPVDPRAARPARFPARQDEHASRAVARRHGLDASRALFAQQLPASIDRGVFHNDVIAVGHERLLLVHEDAFLDQAAVLQALRRAVGESLRVVEVRRDELSVDDAVRTYLFNSQLVTAPSGGLVLIAPSECREHAGASALLDRLVADPAVPIERAVVLDVRESMRNGGGPACLRLRVPLSPDELEAMNPAMRATPAQLAALRAWVERSYPESLAPSELADPQRLRSGRAALDELTRILGLGSIYSFQRA